VELGYDRFKVDRVAKPKANLYRATPLGPDDEPAGPPVAYVRQGRFTIKEEVRFFADEAETAEVFRLKARALIDIGSSRYDVFAGEDRIGFLSNNLRESVTRTTWRVGGPDEREVAVALERSHVGGLTRRLKDFFPFGELMPAPYNFDLVVGGRVVGGFDRRLGKPDELVLDLSGDRKRKIDRRVALALAVALDTLKAR
jgi:hypothetical protein